MVVARPNDETLGAVAQNHSDLLEIAARLFDADDVRVPARKLQQRFGQHVGGRATRNIVDDDGKLRRLRDRAEMAEHSALRRFVVIGYDGEDCVDAGLRRLLRRADRLAGRIRAGVRDDECVAADGRFYRFVERDALGGFERLPFARRAGNDQTVVSAIDQPARQTPGFVYVQLASCVERRHHRGENDSELCVHRTGSPRSRQNCAWTAVSARSASAAGTRMEIVTLLSVQWMISTSACESASAT